MPPVAEKQPEVSMVHGENRVDDYAWLEDKESPAVIAHLEAENRYTEALTKPFDGLREQIYRETVARIDETDETVPVRDGDYYYYSRTEKGKQYSIYCRKRGGLDAEEEVILDLNAMAEGQAFMAVDSYEVSPDGNLLAYTTDVTGFREYTLHVLDMRTGKHWPETVDKVQSVAWAADNQTLFYTVDDHAKRSYRVYRHVLGADPAQDALVYEEADERFRLYVSSSRSKQYIFLYSLSHTTSEQRYLAAAEPTGDFRIIAPRVANQEYYASHRGDRFYIRTNDVGRNFRLVSAPVSAPGRESWQEEVPHRDEIMLAAVDAFESFYVLLEREGGLPHLRVASYDGGAGQRIPMPEPVYSVFGYTNPEHGTQQYLFSYQSLTTPNSVYAYDVTAGTVELRKRTEVLGGYDPADYAAERIFATASDGTRIPVSLVYKKGTPRDGSAPLLLQGYGSYGYSYPVRFRHTRISLLDRGLIVAIAHIRGGGEMGKKWHDQGRMFNKKNTFTDFIAVAEHLVAQGYTKPERLAITGGSAGGLLMGVVINLRPKLFRVVISHVPFVDVLNTMLNDDLPLTVGEYEEWGNPNVPEQYEYIKSYGPYTNIAARDYPTILVTTSLNDSQVMYWEPAKYVAKLRDYTTSGNPVLLRINMDGGHGGSSGRYDQVRETASDYAFLLGQLGLAE
ncbi:S9 family peptidase [Haliangium sp.]|uniref:S9 family peptidase n=1 Tax=Haliangium sp. TaxID=2663208 RepID=UPI003D131FBA